MNAITKLTSVVNDPTIQSDNKLIEICNTVSQAVPHANRVSLWKFNDECSKIECLKVLDPANRSTQGQILYQDDFPFYFEHIIYNQVVMASDARQHYVTKCFTVNYLEPLNIYSLLNFIVHVEHQPKGIIWGERVGKRICWDKTDKVAIKRIANVMSKFVASKM